MTSALAIGQRLGRLVYLGPAAPTRFERHRAPRGLWRCDCGRERRIIMYSVTSGRTRSCGCANQEAVRGWMQALRSEIGAGRRGR